jgi:hypothetical protein
MLSLLPFFMFIIVFVIIRTGSLALSRDTGTDAFSIELSVSCAGCHMEKDFCRPSSAMNLNFFRDILSIDSRTFHC